MNEYQELKFDFPDGEGGTTDLSVEESKMKPVFEEAPEPEPKDNDVEVIVEEEEPSDPAPKAKEEATDEDDLSQYSKAVQKRINSMTRKFHDERRAKEELAKSQHEMEQYTRALMEENKRLKAGAGKNQKALLDNAKRLVDTEITAAKKEYADALDSGNTEVILKAEEKLSTARGKKFKLDSIRIPENGSLQTPDRNVQQQSNAVAQQQQPAQPEPDPKVTAWLADNKWFETNEHMREFALMTHRQLIREGADPQSDEYYDSLNQRVRNYFPDEFSDSEEEPGEEHTSGTATTVAPVSRTPARKQVRLKPSEVAMARQLGVPPAEYAKQKALLKTGGK